MINQINSTSPNKDVFSPLQSSDYKYAVPKPITTKQKEGVRVEKDRTSNALGFSIAASAFIVGLAALALSKGSSRKTRSGINKLFSHADSKTTEMSKKPGLSGLQNFYYIAWKNFKGFLTKSKALFNLAPLKDVVVNRALRQNPTTKIIGDKITKLFERVSLKTSNRSYRKTEARFKTMYASFRDANKTISSVQAEIIEKKIRHIQKKYGEGFSEDARTTRLEKAKLLMQNLEDEVWNETYGNFKAFTENSKYQTFVSEEKAFNTKLGFNKKINDCRKQVTNGKMNDYLESRKLLKTVEDLVDPTDVELREIIKGVKMHLDEYKKVVNINDESQRLNISEKIATGFGILNKSIATKNYDPEALKRISSSVKTLTNTMKENKKGELQEILTIYKNILPENEYLKIKQNAYKATESLDKSIDVEGDKLFDKVRDLMIGAAPTDVVGVLASVGVVGWGLSKADNKDERVSVALKYGIPAIGGVLTSLYCTLGLVAGGPALIIGFLSGIVMNKMGVIADNQIKKYNESKVA